MTPHIENVSEWLLPDELLESSVGDRTAIRYAGQSLTYRRLLELTNQVANFLIGQGLRPRDVIGVQLYDSPFFIATFLGAMKINAVPALISTFAEGRELAHILRLCGARFVLAEADLCAKVLAIRDQLSLPAGRHGAVERLFIPPFASNRQSGDEMPNAELFSFEQASTQRPEGIPVAKATDPAFFLFTSGSTGEPKGVVHAHADICHTVENYGRPVLDLTPADRIFSSSRLFFAYGLGNSLSFPLAARATTILCREKPTPPLVARIFAEEKPTVFFGVPAVYRALWEFHRNVEKLKTESLRFCVSAGEALPAKVFEEWETEFGVEILDGIGTTEALHMFLSNRRNRARAGSSGTLVPGYEARIVDEAGQEAEEGATGSLLVKGPSFGYYFSREKGFVNEFSSKWFRTGDVYRRDRTGFYYYCGRSDDHFKVQGLWVAPLEIENTLNSHEAVLESGVVEMRDEKGLARPRAFVVFKEGKSVSAAELKSFVSHKLHSYQMPHEIVFLDKLPRTATGKLQRYILRKHRASFL